MQYILLAISVAYSIYEAIASILIYEKYQAAARSFLFNKILAVGSYSALGIGLIIEFKFNLDIIPYLIPIAGIMAISMISNIFVKCQSCGAKIGSPITRYLDLNLTQKRYCYNCGIDFFVNKRKKSKKNSCKELF